MAKPGPETEGGVARVGETGKSGGLAKDAGLRGEGWRCRADGEGLEMQRGGERTEDAGGGGG